MKLLPCIDICKAEALVFTQNHYSTLSPQVIDRATSLHIDEGTLQKLFSLPMFAGMDRVMPHEVIVLLLTMRATTLREVIGGVFQVRRDKEECRACLQVYGQRVKDGMHRINSSKHWHAVTGSSPLPPPGVLH